MVESTARIRQAKPSDEKLLRFYIGKANMESLAVANWRSELNGFYLNEGKLMANF
jgi:hypothetical protein